MGKRRGDRRKERRKGREGERDGAGRIAAQSSWLKELLFAFLKGTHPILV